MLAPGAAGVLQYGLREIKTYSWAASRTAQTSVATARMERIAIDISLLKTVSGHEDIMVISDYFTKWIECYAPSDQQA